MDPQKLLVETQRAAGLNLLEDHTELRKLQKEFKVMERRLENSSGTIDSLKEKNSRVERDVQRISEREAIQPRIKQVGVKMVVAEKDEKAEEYQTQKGAVTVLEEEFERSNLAIAPLKEQLVQSKRKVEESKEDQAEFKNLFQIVISKPRCLNIWLQVNVRLVKITIVNSNIFIYIFTGFH